MDIRAMTTSSVVINMLTTRSAQIVMKLLEAEKSLRTKDLSTDLNVSTRTIKSDLEQVRQWFQHQNVSFFSQPNKGYWVECDENERIQLYKSVMEHTNRSFYPDQKLRIEKILYLFFSQKGYITASQISNYLLVSRNTVLSDLKHAEEFIQSWMVKLERKPRVGYRLVGEEIHIRLLFEHVIQESLTNYDMYSMILNNESERIDLFKFRFIEGIQPKFEVILQYIRCVLKKEYTNFIFHAEILSIFIRLIIFLVRMECEYTIGSYRLLKSHQQNSASSKFILHVMTSICNEFDLPLLEDEFLYIQRNFLLGDKEMNLLTITEELIRYVSKKEKIPFHKDTKLFNNLLSHLSLRFEKNTTYVSEVNPFIHEIKRKNTSLFTSIKEVCAKLFKKHTSIVQDSFVSFIALHFLVSYENEFAKKPTIKALYVCSTGRGVARLIKNRVEREIGNIHITTYCSVLEVEEISKNEEIDLIVSVFPLKSTIPVVLVEPVPTEENIQAIREKVNGLLKERNTETYETKIYEVENEHIDYEMMSQEVIIKGFEISNGILNLLSNQISEERKKGLQVHLFLMIHRYYFHKQYDQFIHQSSLQQNDEILVKIMDILHQNQIYINEAEQRALLQYFQLTGCDQT